MGNKESDWFSDNHFKRQKIMILTAPRIRCLHTFLLAWGFQHSFSPAFFQWMRKLRFIGPEWFMQDLIIPSDQGYSQNYPRNMSFHHQSTERADEWNKCHLKMEGRVKKMDGKTMVSFQDTHTHTVVVVNLMITWSYYVSIEVYLWPHTVRREKF